MAKIKGKTYLSQFKHKGDVSCYVMRLATNSSVCETDIAEDNAKDSRLIAFRHQSRTILERPPATTPTPV